MHIVNNKRSKLFDVKDRGIHYGDGVFETILFLDGHAILWDQHLERLRRGCSRLAIAYTPDNVGIAERIREHFPEIAEGRHVLKILITRGVGGRGYRPTSSAPSEVLGVYPAPNVASDLYQGGCDIRSLRTRLSCQPLLAGIKHCNRLEQVLASAELAETEFEGLVYNTDDLLIEGTRSNIILFSKGHWVTPLCDQSGVDGVLKRWMLSNADKLGLELEERPVSRAECSASTSMALANSVFGIVPVRSLDGRELEVSSVLQQIQRPIEKVFPFRQ